MEKINLLFDFLRITHCINHHFIYFAVNKTETFLVYYTDIMQWAEIIARDTNRTTTTKKKNDKHCYSEAN